MLSDRQKIGWTLAIAALVGTGIVIAGLYLQDQFARLQQTTIEHDGRTYELWIESDELALLACARVAGDPEVLFREPFAQMREPGDRYQARIRYVPEITTAHYLFQSRSYSYRLGTVPAPK